MTTGSSNADFVEQHAAPGRIGLCGGHDRINNPRPGVSRVRRAVAALL
jgi:hypothetical protein